MLQNEFDFFKSYFWLEHDSEMLLVILLHSLIEQGVPNPQVAAHYWAMGELGKRTRMHLKLYSEGPSLAQVELHTRAQVSSAHASGALRVSTSACHSCKWSFVRERKHLRSCVKLHSHQCRAHAHAACTNGAVCVHVHLPLTRLPHWARLPSLKGWGSLCLIGDISR